jgi:hypothetical protein
MSPSIIKKAPLKWVEVRSLHVERKLVYSTYSPDSTTRVEDYMTLFVTSFPQRPKPLGESLAEI